MMQISTVLANALMVTGSLKDQLDGGSIYIYSGPVPATADVAIDGDSDLLCTINSDGSGVTFEATADNGVLTKTASETWSGTVDTAGTAAFLRFCVGSDDGSGAATTGNFRLQGTIGVNASFDLIEPNTTFTAAEVRTIDIFQVFLPLV